MQEAHTQTGARTHATYTAAAMREMRVQPRVKRLRVRRQRKWQRPTAMLRAARPHRDRRHRRRRRPTRVMMMTTMMMMMMMMMIHSVGLVA